MMSEDYVSFETAKLLKEKGFDSECHSYYYPCHYPDGSIEYHRDKGAQSRTKIWYNVYSLKTLPKDHYLAPTIQMAMKWLRDVHNLTIDVFHFRGWRVIIKTISDDCFKADYSYPELKPVETYEEAAEVAIKYCFENLI